MNYTGYPYGNSGYGSSISAPSNDNGLIWVQGIEGAKSYLVAPNKTVLLMDSEQEQFFLKSADASGMPLPLRIFKYSEIISQHPNSNYVTKTEFEALVQKLDALIGKEETKHVEPTV